MYGNRIVKYEKRRIEKKEKDRRAGMGRMKIKKRRTRRKRRTVGFVSFTGFVYLQGFYE